MMGRTAEQSASGSRACQRAGSGDGFPGSGKMWAWAPEVRSIGVRIGGTRAHYPRSIVLVGARAVGVWEPGHRGGNGFPAAKLGGSDADISRLKRGEAA